MIGAAEFNAWMEKNEFTTVQREQYIRDPNKALLDFLTKGKGFTQIKNYPQFIQLERAVRLTYGYKTSITERSLFDFGKAIIKVMNSMEIMKKNRSLKLITPQLPKEVKLWLLAEHFDCFMKKNNLLPNKENEPKEHKIALRGFLDTYGVLEQIQDYATYFQLARHIQKSYAYNIQLENYYDEFLFYKVAYDRVLDNTYFGVNPMVIPETFEKEFQKKPILLEIIELDEETIKMHNPAKTKSGIFSRSSQNNNKNASPRSLDDLMKELSPRDNSVSSSNTLGQENNRIL